MDNQDSNQAFQRKRERLCLLFLGVVFFALTVWSWRKWTDAQVDFGLQLYTPWQLAQGKVLYRDVSYIAGGPLSQYFHALLFRVLGASYTVVAVSNLCVAWLVTWGLFRLFARAADRLTASLIAVVMLLVFVFGHLMYVGNFNFITPYTCETVHGLALSVLAIAGLCRWLATGRTGWVFAAGLASGGVFLTKPEVFVALMGAVTIAIVVRETTVLPSPGMRWKNLFALAAGFALLLVGFVLYFVTVWPTRDGWWATAGAWLPLLAGRAGLGRFYQWCLGLDVPGENFTQMLQYTALFALVLAAFAMAARFFQRRNFILAGLVCGGLAGFLFSTANPLEWVQGGRALPPLTLAGGVLVVWSWWKTRREPAGGVLVFPLLWSVFALLLLTKMGLNSRIWQYGFYLALPATAFLLYVIFWLLPPVIAPFEVSAKVFRVCLLVFFSVGLGKLVWLSNYYYESKSFALGRGSDRIMVYGRDMDASNKGDALKVTVQWLSTNTPASSTLAVFPEGTMINYLARRANPTPYLVACPHELQVAGETNVVAAYAAQPPDYVLLWHRSTREFGVGFFGAEDGYGRDLMRWVKDNYSAVWLLGSEPLVTNRFGAMMFRRKTL